MKRSLIAIIFLICAGFSVYGQNSNPIDLVLLLDTSSDMSSSNEKVNEYLTGAFLTEFLRVGDTFHLIAYSGAARLDAARRIQSKGDVETIIGRMLLQYPVEKGNDARAAITFAEQYVAALPPRPKKIVMVGTGGQDINNLLGSAKQRLNSRNSTLDFVQVTSGQSLSNLPASGRPAAVRSSSSQRSASQASQTTPASSSTAAPSSRQTDASSTTAASPGASTSSTTAAPGSSAPGSTASTATPGASTSTAAPGSPAAAETSTSTSPSSTTSTSTAPGSTTSTGTPGSTATTAPGSTATTDARSGESGSGKDAPLAGGNQADKNGSGARANGEKTNGRSWASSLPLIIGLIILALIILLLIIIFASRRLGSSPNRVIASASSYKQQEKEDAKSVDHSKDLAKYASAQSVRRTTPYADRPSKPENSKPPEINPAGPLLLNLFVEDQNTAIGRRNIHSLKSGYSLSVGGGKGDDYYIFLVPFPSKIGEIRRDGKQCTFIPHKPKYFPDIGSNEVRDCINKTIRIISDKNYEVRFRFEMYEDPLIALNRILMSVRVPG